MPVMSIAALKETVDTLNSKERSWLRNYLAIKERSSNPAWKAEMTQRLRRMRAGHEISSDEYYRRTRELDRSRGRKGKAA